MDAEKLVFLTDIEGVFIDPANKKTLISEMDIKTAKESRPRADTKYVFSPG